MRYFFAKLHPPRPTFAQDMSPAEAKLMAEHAAYLGRFSAQGWAVAYGPVADPGGAYGVAIWELPEGEEVHAICATDPTIQSGLGFRYEIHPMPRAIVRK